MTEKGEETREEDTQQQRLNVVRIKRKRSEQPVDSLLLELPSSKKTLLNSFKSLSTQEKEPTAESDSGPKLFCLVGTVTSHDTPARLKDKINEAQQKRKLMLRPKSSTEQVQEVHREKHKIQNKEARAKEIKLLREGSKQDEGFSALFHLVDLVKADDSVKPKVTPVQSKNKVGDEEITCNYMPMVREYLTSQAESGNVPIDKDDDDDYVYDVYYNDASLRHDNSGEYAVARIESFDEELTIEHEYDDGDTDSDDEENRVTDIYPDEDEDPEFEAGYGSSSEEENSNSSDDVDLYDDDGDEDKKIISSKRYVW